MQKAWNHWYHITANPYGQWLRGDPRGWRERNHRLHVHGDYKHPPPPTAYNHAIYEQSKRLMKFPPVAFAVPDRQRGGILILQSLDIQKINALAVGVGEKHLHLLIQCPQDNPKIVTGKAKNHVWMQMINEGDKLRPRAEVPPLWAVGSHPVAITDRKHQLNAFWYVLEHRAEGAWVWCYRHARGEVCRHTRAGGRERSPRGM
jgi:hypothetical protein